MDLFVAVPRDWDGISNLTLWIVWAGFPGSTGNAKWRVQSARFAPGTSLNNLAASLVTGVGTFVDDQLIRTEFILPLTGAAGTVAAGDALMLVVARNSGDVDDTGSTGARVVAAGLDYNAL
jgi:hypothetical protein